MLYIHTRSKNPEALRGIRSCLEQIAHVQIYQLKYIEDRKLATWIKGFGNEDALGNYCIKVAGTNNSKLDETGLNQHGASVWYFLESHDLIWAISRGNNLPLKGVCNEYGRVHCNVTLGMGFDKNNQKVDLSSKKQCVFYAKNCIWDSSHSVDLVAVPIQKQKNMNVPSSKQDVYNGTDEDMLGRTVIMQGV